MNQFEEHIQSDLHAYLLSMNEIEKRLPKNEDIEEKWQSIAEAYLPDGMREYNSFPTASLGWMMYVGMAVAMFWDEDWATYSKLDNIYTHLRDAQGYDTMDEHICRDILKLQDDDSDTTEKLVGECASRTDNILRHGGFEAGTKSAFYAYVDCLHQMYCMGAAVQLYRMGYRMTKL